MNTNRVLSTLSILRKKRQRRTVYLGCFLALVLFAVAYFSDDYLLVTPVEGGSFSEGMVGYPRFINPILAQSPTDKDLTELMFSGLLKKDTQGVYIPELAASLQIGENETEYIMTLNDDIYFHDGTPITINDVLFTYALAQDPLMKSPLYPKLLRVDISADEDGFIVFTLPEPQLDFEENLTLGIMSEAQWSDISIEEFPFAEQNITPVGSGPYQIQNITRDNKQKISNFVLNAFRENTLTPYIDSITVKFYENQADALYAFENNLIDNFGNISAQELLSLDHSLDDKHIQTQPLSRIFSLFFNPNQNPLFESDEIREAVSLAVDKQKIIDTVFFARASTADGPLPVNHAYYTPSESEMQNSEQIIKKLTDAKWAVNDEGIFEKTIGENVVTASFNLSVPQVTELEKVAVIIRDELAKVNIKLSIIVTEERNFTTQVIRKRDFDAVLFGQIIQDPSQLFGFWHSSGVDDPGVNIAGYKNNTVDAILERLIEQSYDVEKNTQDYNNLQKRIRTDLPAVALFSPHFIYASNKSIKQNDIKNISFASDRFEYISDWYIKTESILPWFDVDTI